MFNYTTLGYFDGDELDLIFLFEAAGLKYEYSNFNIEYDDSDDELGFLEFNDVSEANFHLMMSIEIKWAEELGYLNINEVFLSQLDMKKKYLNKT